MTKLTAIEETIINNNYGYLLTNVSFDENGTTEIALIKYMITDLSYGSTEHTITDAFRDDIVRILGDTIEWFKVSKLELIGLLRSEFPNSLIIYKHHLVKKRGTPTTEDLISSGLKISTQWLKWEVEAVKTASAAEEKRKKKIEEKRRISLETSKAEETILLKKLLKQKGIDPNSIGIT